MTVPTKTWDQSEAACRRQETAQMDSCASESGVKPGAGWDEPTPAQVAREAERGPLTTPIQRPQDERTDREIQKSIREMSRPSEYVMPVRIVRPRKR